MPRRRPHLRNLAEDLAFRFILWTLRRVPRETALRLGGAYARLLDLLAPRLRRTARENLKRAFPEWSPEQRERTADGAFCSIGRVLALFARFPTLDARGVREWIAIEGIEHVDAALARGRGVMFATGHLGNWELSAFAFAYLARPISIVVRPLDNPLLDRTVTRYRERSGNRSIGKREFARRILEALRRNEMVGILADQHDADGEPAPFFGYPARTSLGLARIAGRTGAAVVPGFALWDAARRRFTLRFLPEVAMTGDAREDTARIQAVLEEVIRQYPDQWLWMHRRWKS